MEKQFNLNNYQAEIINEYPNLFKHYTKEEISEIFQYAKHFHGIDVSNLKGKTIFNQVMIPDLFILEKKRIPKQIFLKLNASIWSNSQIEKSMKSLADLRRYNFSDGYNKKSHKNRDAKDISDKVIGDIENVYNLLSANKLKESRHYLTKYKDNQDSLTNYELLLISSLHLQTRKLYFMKQTYHNLSCEEFQEKLNLWKTELSKVVSSLHSRKKLNSNLENKTTFNNFLARTKRKIQKIDSFLLNP